MPRGASSKREHEYEELKGEFQREHRYPGREEEVAARIVNKQRREHGETKAQQQQDRNGESPDRRLPVRNYERMTVEQITAELDGMDEHELEEILHYERAHANRKTLVEQLDRRTDHADH